MTAGCDPLQFAGGVGVGVDGRTSRAPDTRAGVGVRVEVLVFVGHVEFEATQAVNSFEHAPSLVV